MKILHYYDYLHYEEYQQLVNTILFVSVNISNDFKWCVSKTQKFSVKKSFKFRILVELKRHFLKNGSKFFEENCQLERSFSFL